MVELIPKETPQIPRWLNIVFYFSLLILFFSIISFFVLGNSIKKAQSALQGLEIDLFEARTAERVVLEKEIINYEKKINDFFSLAPHHLEASFFFGFLERITHPQVWFPRINFDADQSKVYFGGTTRNFESLGQQILIFQQENFISDVNLEKVSIDRTGDINFDLSFSVNLELLK